MITVTKDNFKSEVLESSKPVVIDVYAPWCGPCSYMEPIFEELSQEQGHIYTFVKLNVDEARDLAIQFKVTSIPTFLFFEKGVLKGKEMGALEKEELLQKIVSYLG
jgi:thioredoxin